MSITPRTALLWAPRVLAILTAIFVGLFALDAFGEGRSFWEGLAGFLIHLAPVYVLIAAVVLAWRRPWVGALVFLGLALLYAFAARTHPGWIVAISGPLAIVGVLYLIGWRMQPPPSSA